MARELPIISEYASGWRPGGSDAGNEAQGHLSTQEGVSGLVRVPWKYGQFEVLSTSASLPVLRGEAYRGNGDGSGQAITVTITANASATACDAMRIRFSFTGRVFALRWQKGYDSSATLASPPRNFSAVIDGVAYEIDNSQVKDFVYSQSLLNTDLSLPQFMPLYPSGDVCVVVADDLPDGVHQCELVFQGDASGGVTKRWTIFGYACESRVGYVDHPRLTGFCRQQAVGNGTFAVPDYVHPLNASDLTNYPRAVAAIYYNNTTGSAITVTVQTYYNNATAETVEVISVPANGTAKFSPPSPIAIDRGAVASGATVLRHSASATGVNAKVLGVF